MLLKKGKYLSVVTICVLIGILGTFFQPVKALGDVRILSHSSFYDTLNDLWVVGEVENTGNMATRFTKITATFYDASHQVVTTDSGYSELDVLLPGRKSPFTILLLEAEGALNVHNYTLTVSWDNYAAGKALGLEILSNNSYIDGYGWMHVTGEIENQGSMGASYVEAIATFYDSTEVVVGVGWDYTEPSYLSPNQTGTFDIDLIYSEQVMKVAVYSLTAESIEYAHIPEFLSLIILPLFMITTLLAVIIYRKKHTM